MQLSLSSQLSALSASALILGFGSGALRAQVPQPFHMEFSTHDATTTAGSPAGLREVWADVKSTGALMPGRGWRFAVGTIEVKTTRPQDHPRFSDGPDDVELPPSPVDPAGFNIPTGAAIGTKQIVILQARGPAAQTGNGSNTDQEIRWQRFFYGESGLINGPIGRPGTNARGISVWPVLDEHGDIDQEETRIVICGESFECLLPNSQYANGLDGRTKFFGPGPFAASFPRGLPSGFLAVYRGTGEHLWTHQFCFQDVPITPGQPEGSCAITDVSIRVEGEGENQRDVVTYCGISSFGTLDANLPWRALEASSLAPLRPFDLSGGVVEGEHHNGLGQWDGIVGRVSHVHSNLPVAGTGATREFHSMVGGREQDGLWGIAELPDQRFVVVGSTATMRAPNPSSSSQSFPFTPLLPLPVNPLFPWPAVEHCLGTMLVFDASQTRNTSGPTDLILETASPLGWAGLGALEQPVTTVARDVTVGLEAHLFAPAPPLHRFAIVGSTNDATLMNSLQPLVWTAPTNTFAGPTDGFLVTVQDRALAGQPQFWNTTFQGSDEPSGWCGVHAWNEFLDHISVYGWVQGDSSQDLEMVSFVDCSSGSSGVTPLLELRRGTIPTPGREVPAAMGEWVATAPPAPAVVDWDPFDLESPAGGGICMDERGRLDLVGSTEPVGTTAPGFPHTGLFSRPWLSGVDAVRSVATMLPMHVGRTDRSGEQVHAWGTIPPPPAGFTGSTTPTCALLPFGRQIGSAVPPLRRMLVDWEGDLPYANPVPVHFLRVDRPPDTWQFAATLVQFGVPTAPTTLVSGIENWVPSGIVTNVLIPSSGLVRVPLLLPAPPPGGITFSAQVLTASLVSFACTGDVFAATPAIVFSY